MKKDTVSGMWYRENTYDKAIIRSMNRDYFNFLKIDDRDRVLDIGANIGAFACRAAVVAEWTICFEPDQRNFKLLHKNLLQFNTAADLFGKAVTRTDGEKVKLWRNKGTNLGSHSIVQYRGRRGTSVPSIGIEKVFSKYGGFTIMKVDIEGYEYILFKDLEVPWTIKQIVIEFHLNRLNWRFNQAPKLVESLKDQGFKVVREPKLVASAKNWYSMGVFRR